MVLRLQDDVDSSSLIGYLQFSDSAVAFASDGWNSTGVFQLSLRKCSTVPCPCPLSTTSLSFLSLRLDLQTGYTTLLCGLVLFPSWWLSLLPPGRFRRQCFHCGEQLLARSAPITPLFTRMLPQILYSNASNALASNALTQVTRKPGKKAFRRQKK